MSPKTKIMLVLLGIVVGAMIYAGKVSEIEREVVIDALLTDGVIVDVTVLGSIRVSRGSAKTLPHLYYYIEYKDYQTGETVGRYVQTCERVGSQKLKLHCIDIFPSTSLPVVVEMMYTPSSDEIWPACRPHTNNTGTVYFCSDVITYPPLTFDLDQLAEHSSAVR
jgi:hypothetical protein